MQGFEAAKRMLPMRVLSCNAAHEAVGIITVRRAAVASSASRLAAPSNAWEAAYCTLPVSPCVYVGDEAAQAPAVPSHRCSECCPPPPCSVRHRLVAALPPSCTRASLAPARRSSATRSGSSFVRRCPRWQWWRLARTRKLLGRTRGSPKCGMHSWCAGAARAAGGSGPCGRGEPGSWRRLRAEGSMRATQVQSHSSAAYAPRHLQLAVACTPSPC